MLFILAAAAALFFVGMVRARAAADRAEDAAAMWQRTCAQNHEWYARHAEEIRDAHAHQLVYEDAIDLDEETIARANRYGEKIAAMRANQNALAARLLEQDPTLRPH